jgi:CRP-like cAMP-binding protein
MVIVSMSESYAELIPGFPLFKGFTTAGADMILERGTVRECPAGTLFFSEGDQSTSVLLVLSGQVEVFVTRNGSHLVLLEAGPGAIVGELAVLCGTPRSGSVRAPVPSTVLEWSETNFRRLLLGDPFLSQRILGQSLRVLVEKERSLIDSLMAKTGEGGA